MLISIYKGRVIVIFCFKRSDTFQCLLSPIKWLWLDILWIPNPAVYRLFSRYCSMHVKWFVKIPAHRFNWLMTEIAIIMSSLRQAMSRIEQRYTLSWLLCCYTFFPPSECLFANINIQRTHLKLSQNVQRAFLFENFALPLQTGLWSLQAAKTSAILWQVMLFAPCRT